MKLKELKPGDIFTIENTPTYPKLKLQNGYVDIRDEIVNRRGNCDEREVSILAASDIATAFDDIGNIDLIKKWLNDAITKWRRFR